LDGQPTRASADDAWRRKDFVAVANAYKEILTGLHSIRLKPSEVGRLRGRRDELASRNRMKPTTTPSHGL